MHGREKETVKFSFFFFFHSLPFLQCLEKSFEVHRHVNVKGEVSTSFVYAFYIS